MASRGGDRSFTRPFPQQVQPRPRRLESWPCRAPLSNTWPMATSSHDTPKRTIQTMWEE